MVVEQHRPVGGEHLDELGLGEGVWVLGLFDEDHQIGNVDDADLQSGRDSPKKLGGFDHLEGHFDADTG